MNISHSSKKYSLALSLLVLSFTVFGLGCAHQSASSSGVTGKDLEARINSLEERLNNVETVLSRDKVQAEMEAEARNALSQITALVGRGEVVQAKADLAHFLERYANLPAARRAQQLYVELSVVGSAVPDNWGIEKWFQGEREIGSGPEKATLIVFWEVWCKYCRQEVPKLQALYTALNDQGLEVIGITQVNRGATEEGVKEFISTQKLTYPIAKEDESISQYFKVSGIPAAAVIKDGQIVWRGHPALLSEPLLQMWL